jgi:hypothetical protein
LRDKDDDEELTFHLQIETAQGSGPDVAFACDHRQSV